MIAVKINSKLIMDLSLLAKIQLSESEVKKYAEELSRIISYFQILEKINTEKAEPTFHAISSHKNVFQTPQIDTTTLTQADVLKNAQSKQNGYITTQKVLKK